MQSSRLPFIRRRMLAFAVFYFGFVAVATSIKLARGIWTRQDTIYTTSFVLMSALIFSVVGLYFRFQESVAPMALQLWAKNQGVQLVRAEMVVNPFEKLRSWPTASNMQILYRVGAIGPGGPTLNGVARVGSFWWFTLIPERCPVEIGWNPPCDKKPPIQDFLSEL